MCVFSSFNMWKIVKFTLLTLCAILSMSEASGHYCLWGLCSTSEYCCGYNECCSESSNFIDVASIIGKVSLVLAICITLVIIIYSYISRRRHSRSSIHISREDINQETSIIQKDVQGTYEFNKYQSANYSSKIMI
ncbi:uncharacterized protein [Prorops nasuta]|uniref:uncharacterized protein n=1 Tax=Prorops nasuta TaxID=863751 RepID=UPI0034CD2BA6